MKVFTLGVYGYTENEFFQELKVNNIHFFVDIRRIRGMRGSKYAFVNSKYLQSKLSELGIEYIYEKQLAPTKEIRDSQKEEDSSKGTNKQSRSELSEVFVDRYKKECLAQFNMDLFLERFDSEVNIVLFCVEKNPHACHRSIVTEEMVKYPYISIYNILRK